MSGTLFLELFSAANVSGVGLEFEKQNTVEVIHL